MKQLEVLRQQIRQHTHADENATVKRALDALTAIQQNFTLREQALENARNLVSQCRNNEEQRGTLDAFLQEFGLSNNEGLALMCIAESLLRIPDADTADEFIAEKIRSGNWHTHLGQSKSLFVNASTWGLVLTGKIMKFEEPGGGQWFAGIVNRLGEPVVRKAMLQAMKILGGQYVLGRNIGEAIKRGEKDQKHYTIKSNFSFDMLGEGARTQSAAHRYFAEYESAIHAIGKKGSAYDVYQANGISIKLSALHPRFEYSKLHRVKEELFHSVLSLAKQAKQYNIGLNIDAEESERLDITLEIFEMLARSPELDGWNGLGFVLQAYQKRSLTVAQWLSALARETGHRFMIRLVKGAYWDREIKYAQESGHIDYPVFTRKANTDLNYLACANILLANNDVIYPQFATHNAYTVAFIQLIAQNKDFEFQRLHGMGQLIFNHIGDVTTAPANLRIYAPVGAHKELLPYLVRRLLENGANSSFVHYFLDERVAITDLVQDVFAQVTEREQHKHHNIPLPIDIFRQASIPRTNSLGLDLNNAIQHAALLQQFEQHPVQNCRASSIINGESIADANTDWLPISSPANTKILLGSVAEATPDDIENAVKTCRNAQRHWDQTPVEQRALFLENIAQRFEAHRDELLQLICKEAGRSLEDAISEYREAVDFCHYYAQLARQQFSPQLLTSPTGEDNTLSLHGRGTFVCISPWNFPMAIFTGQVTAALVSGNCVIAKPAEQTSIIAFRIVQLMHEAGIPNEVLQLLVGDGARIGNTLIKDSRISGVAFTGSTETAKIIHRQIAERDGEIIPLIAETGGLNAMIVDSSALPEQVVDDVIHSAFYSAGQRCSALRVLFLQSEIADSVISMLQGACDEIKLGEPWQLETDIGPVIDQDALNLLQQHIQRMNGEAQRIYPQENANTPHDGYFLAPHIYEINSLSQLKREVFGPILHIVRFQSNEIDTIIEDINSTGYGLTFGIHSRLESRARTLAKQLNVGNIYVNRNMVGAVVGVNPFGGQGLSGTGPKAGGPHYLTRFASEKTFTVNTVATGGNTELLSLVDSN
ncbi:Bifunctional protein PutA [Thalassocella blandensis]|nr:Bifunctional protein PutA [Thalassocella blandensis]